MKDEKEARNPRQSRRPYADLGMTVAVSLLIIMIVKSLLFGLTLMSLTLMVLPAAYIVVCAVHDSWSRVVQHSTTLLLLCSALCLAGTFFFDRPTRPKMVAFQARSENDTVVHAAEPVVETPQPVQVDTTDVVAIDTLDYEVTDSVDVVPLEEEVLEKTDSALAETEVTDILP